MTILTLDTVEILTNTFLLFRKRLFLIIFEEEQSFILLQRLISPKAMANRLIQVLFITLTDTELSRTHILWQYEQSEKFFKIMIQVQITNMAVNYFARNLTNNYLAKNLIHLLSYRKALSFLGVWRNGQWSNKSLLSS